MVSAGPSIRKVAVIGAGASGITAIKELLRQGFEVTAFEARSQVGGAWIRSSKPPGECIISFDRSGRPFPQTKKRYAATTSKNSIAAEDYPTVLEPSPMYRLKTNIPCDLMSYRGAPFTDTSGPFPRDDEVLKYLEDYAQDVLPYIRFNRLVKRIYKRQQSWIVETSDALQQQHAPSSKPASEIEEYDAICDCSGHYTRPYIPFVKGLWTYKRKILHAKWYRTPEVFEGMDVLVVGNSASGYDISREIALHYKKTNSKNRIYQSRRSMKEIGIDPSEGPPWATHLHGVGGIDHVTEEEVVLLDGTRLKVDIIIFATGYLYSFPYFKHQDSPFNEHPLTVIPPVPQDVADDIELGASAEYPDGGLRVHNLDAEYQTFYEPDPTLALICLNKSVIPFPLAQAQAHAVARYWAGHTFRLKPDTSTEESPQLHTYGAPKEFDVADALLKASGAGKEDEDEEILSDGSFPATSRWRREKRPLCKAYRKQELGY